MLVLLIAREYNNDSHWFWVPLVGCLRKVPITHYKPNNSGGADDILQLEHTGIYKIQYTPDTAYNGSEIETAMRSIFLLQGQDSLDLSETTLRIVYESISKLRALFTACSSGRITSVTNRDTVLQYDITGWADEVDQTQVLTYAKLNIYTHQSDGSSTNIDSGGSSTHIGLLSIPKDTIQVRIINITKIAQNNDDSYSYAELINATINNKILIDNSSYFPNTLNLHLYIGEVSSINITQQSTYKIDNKTKNVTPHIYPPTVHGYGTTLMPMEKNTAIESMNTFTNHYIELNNSEANMLFYDVLG
jgi:hypothetical protein